MESKGKMIVMKGDGKATAADLYTPLAKLPGASSRFKLTSDQNYWYNYFGEQLIATKRLMRPDLIHLHRLARSVDYYIQAEEKIQEHGYYGGLIQTFKNGTTNVSGHITIREKMLKEIDDLSKHFGFSFLDRKKLKDDKPVDDGQLNAFDELQKALRQSS